MPHKAIVAIGVDKVGGGLPKLSAAASGAREVASWLGKPENGYDVDLFTDDDGPVERRDIFHAINSRVEAANLSRLVIYFAGHGFLKNTADEYWLLSGAPADSAEAVNVTLSEALARFSGIPELIFISDACRVVPSEQVHSSISGASIFPNLHRASQGAEVDFFYATHPGDPAHERAPAEAKAAHGLFTKELLSAHLDAPNEGLVEIEGKTFVRNRWLKKVIGERVDLRAQEISLKLSQVPDVRLEMENGVVARREGQSPRVLSKSMPVGTAFELVNGRKKIRLPAQSVATDVLLPQRLSDIERGYESGKHLAESAGRTPQALTCLGEEATIVAGSHGLSWDSQQHGDQSLHILNMDGQAANVAVMFEDGSGMLLPVLRDYQCEILRSEGRTVSLAYSWSEWRDPQVAKLRAGVLSAATLGRLDRSQDGLRNLAQTIRQGKKSDPILGIVAALAFAVSGDFDGARSVRNYMRRDLNIDLFDAWLLGGAEGGLPVLPPVPLLGQTWSFLDLFNTDFSEAFKILPRVPGFWTVFASDAMDAITDIVSDGSVDLGGFL